MRRFTGQWENGKVNTRRVERPFRQAGILIFDKDGVEGGGYLTEDTHDNALLTLDDKQRQEVLLSNRRRPHFIVPHVDGKRCP